MRDFKGEKKRGEVMTHLIKVGPDHAIKDPLAVGTVHDHEGMELIYRHQIRYVEVLHVRELGQNCTGLLFGGIVGVWLQGVRGHM